MKLLTTSCQSFFILLLLMSSFPVQSQLPEKVLVGYWENWSSLRIKDVDPRYNVIMLSFLEADKDFFSTNNVVADLEFTPGNPSAVKQDIKTVQIKGKKVLFSIGGEKGSFKLSSVADKNTFVTKVTGFIEEYGVDGIDIDIEQKDYLCMTTGTLDKPEAHIQYLIDGIKEVKAWFESKYGKRMILTAAPETLYVHGGLSQWATCGGSFLPVIEQLRDDIDLLMVQLYNSGEMFDLNKVARAQGTQEFVVAMTDAVITGFNTSQGFGAYSGFPANKVAVGLPACATSGSGYLSSADMVAAVKYLMGKGPKVGSYSLQNGAGFPDLRGLMTWSINGDAKTNCGSYSFADAAEQILGPIGVEKIQTVSTFKLFPNPSTAVLNMERKESDPALVLVRDNEGRVVLQQSINSQKASLNISQLSPGFYTVSIGESMQKFIKE